MKTLLIISLVFIMTCCTEPIKVENIKGKGTAFIKRPNATMGGYFITIIERDGHEYLFAYSSNHNGGAGLCHSESCKCKD